MPPKFFPDPVFGWIFYAVLLGFLAVATYSDLKWLTIPKKLTLTLLGLGVLFSLVRGIWLGAVYEGTDEAVFYFGASPLTGALAGLVSALAGFAVGFGIYTLMWLLGMAGGGDVKLMAAVGAWVGPKWVIWLAFGSLMIFSVLVIVRMLQKVFRRGVQKSVFGVKERAAGSAVKKTKAGAVRKDRVIAWSLPLAVATGFLLPFFAPADLRLPLQLPVKTAPSPQASTQP
jgi:prepilin peptidase CpaA